MPLGVELLLPPSQLELYSANLQLSLHTVVEPGLVRLQPAQLFSSQRQLLPLNSVVLEQLNSLL
jgi:hypothetical protein